jgi:hypothetical protein
MAKIQEIEQVWNDDNHSIVLRINKSELEVLEVVCPHEGKAACKNMMDDCVIQWFVNRFGMDCNGGMCPPIENLQICWTIVGDINDFDSCQIWFMPKTDEVFAAWLISNQPSGELSA